MARLLQEEEDEQEEAADKDFYQQDFWADAEEDGDFEYAGDAEGSDRGDSFDSDFGDSTESEDDDDDDDDEKAAKKSAPKKKSVYKDPKLAHKKGSAAAAAAAAAAGSALPASRPSHKRKPRPELDLAPIERSKRKATEEASQVALDRRKALAEEAKARAAKSAAARSRGNVELRRLTQEEILAEAMQTEIINRASLERMLRIEEEKRRVTVRERKTDGPRVKYHSKRAGDSVINTVTFVDTPVPKAIDGIAPPYPPPQRCAVTSAPAKYIDPQTGTPYATLEAFRMLRGRTGRRHSFGGGAQVAAAAGASSGAADD